MKKYISKMLILIGLVLAANTASAVGHVDPVIGDPLEKPVKIRCTCYNDTGLMANGKPVRKGAIAGKKEWLGKAALLYTYKEVDGEYLPLELIGIYEVLDYGAGIDTDGDGEGDTIPNGQSIDVWMETGTQVEEWQALYGDYVLLHLVDGKG